MNYDQCIWLYYIIFILFLLFLYPFQIIEIRMKRSHQVTSKLPTETRIIITTIKIIIMHRSHNHIKKHLSIFCLILLLKKANSPTNFLQQTRKISISKLNKSDSQNKKTNETKKMLISRSFANVRTYLSPTDMKIFQENIEDLICPRAYR